MMAYADDIAIVANSEEDLRRALVECNGALTRWGMKVNKDKTEVMMIARERRELQIEVEGMMLRCVDSFNYLGMLITAGGEMMDEIENRINKYSANVGQLYPILRERNIPRDVKVVIFTTILRPILLYGAESWTLTTKTRSKLVAAEMRVLHMIRGVSRMDRMRNADIRKDLGVEALE